MEKQTAIEWFIEQLADKNLIGLNGDTLKLIGQAKEMEKQQAHEYAEFAIRCDRKEMKILNFDGFIKLD